MPINTANLMPRLSPLAAIEPSSYGGSLERQKLKLMKQQFEEAKRQNRESEELRRISEAGEMRRAEMAMERQQAEAAATLAAQQQKQQLDLAAEQRKNAQAAYGDVFKAQDGSDFAGMEAAGARLREYGGLFEETGRDAQGRPSYRIGTSAAERGERLGQRDAVTREMTTQAPEGSVWLPNDVAQKATLSRLNALGLDNLDREGIVDMGALMDQRRAQAGPVLESLRGGLPEGDYKDSRGATNEAILQLGLPPKEAAEMQLKLQAPADAAIGKELDADRDFQKAELTAQRAYEKEMRDAKSDRQKQAIALARDGRDNAATQWKDQGLHKLGEADKAADQIEDMLSNAEHLDDQQIAHLFVKLKGSIGPQSDKEIDAVFGTADMSAPELVFEKIRNFFAGGVGDDIKKALIAIVNESVESNDERVYSFLDSMENTLESPETTEEAKRGWRQFRDSIDERHRKAWDEDRKAQGLPTFEEMERDRKPLDEEPGMRGTPVLHEGITADSDFMDVFTEAAISAGIDPELVLPLINHESGGDPQAANKKSSAKGLIQFLDSTAQRYGFADSAEFAKLSAAEQAPYVIQYLVDSGVNESHDQGDIYVAIAAPGALEKSDDAEVYKRGSDEYGKNTTWDLDGDGVITRGELYRWGMGERREGGRSKAAKRQAETEAKGAGKPGKNDSELDRFLE